MSNSVQLEIGNTRIFSPLCNLALYRDHNSGRCALGSHWPNSSRNEKIRSLARAFSSSRRAPPIKASNPFSAMVSNKVTACAALRESVSLRNTTVPLAMESSTCPTTKRALSFATCSSRNWITSG